MAGWARRLCSLAAGLWLLIGQIAIPRGIADSAEASTVDLAVDARELPRRLLHSRIEITCRPGRLTLWFPKWIPGTHAPCGPVENVAGLRIEAPDGKSLDWSRDEVEPYRVACEVPTGARSVVVRLDTICNEAAVLASGHLSYGNESIGIINWNTCLMYPEGPACDAIRVRASLRLPAGWRHATALAAVTAPSDRDAPPATESQGQVRFQAVSLTELVDNPVLAAEHLRSLALDVGGGPPAYFHVASESPSALQLGPDVVSLYSRMVREAGALFGPGPYPSFHFLVTCSDDVGYSGLEHLACSMNGVRERDLLDPARRRGWVANLLPHEYVHSWCGKFRRPTGMCTADFHTPQKTRLLWIYEGLAEYLGEVLTVRSGLADANEYREMLATTISSLSHRAGRRWRSLEDTAVASHLLRKSSPNWNDLRREQDYYAEGALLWLEVDAIVRDRSQGKFSLDDFCRRFLGASTAGARVLPYVLPDVVKTLRDLVDFDWDGFFARRTARPMDALPLEVLGRCGYRLGYAAEPSSYLRYIERGTVMALDSIGLTFGADGRILTVIPGMAGDRAGLAPGMKVIGVNQKTFHSQRLHDALADSIARRKIDLLLLEGESFRTIVLDYADGPRYLELVRDPARPDLLAEILRPAADRSH